MIPAPSLLDLEDFTSKQESKVEIKMLKYERALGYFGHRRPDFTFNSGLKN